MADACGEICIETEMMTPCEKFPDDALCSLRTELLHAGLDSFQVAHLLAAFLAQRGYGVCTEDVRASVAYIEARGCTLPLLQAELERLAYVM